MAELQNFLLVVEDNREEAIRIAGVTAQKLENKQATLIDIVQSLGEYINDEDINIRGKAVSYLTAVIKALSHKFLSRQQIQVLTTFYCARIEDGGAIAGLRTLQGLDRFNKEMAQMTVQALFQHFMELQGRPQSQRFQVLQLLNELMANHREGLRELKDESLLGIMNLVSGERDPRNLMIVFSILKALMVEWDISDHAQALFDAAYNYFPITFRPPPNDPYGVTAMDLKDRLQDCISSTQLFAPHAFPSLLDKLDSTSMNVKRDALRALTACIESYGPPTLARYSITIWDSLKFEILNAQDEVLPEESLGVLRALAVRLSVTPQATLKRSYLSQFLKPILNECNEQLREPQLKQAKPAREILSSLSSASASAFTLVIEAVFSPLLRIYQEADGIAKQREILETFVALFGSATIIFGAWTSTVSKPELPNPLIPYKDNLTDIFSKSLMGSAKDEIAFRLTAIKGLLQMSILRDFLQDNEIGLFVQYLDDILLHDHSARDELRKETVRALAEISKYKSKLIIEITFPALMATLPDSDAEADLQYILTLDNLAQISTERDVLDTLVRRLLSKLDIVLLPESSSSPAYAGAILMTILSAMKHRKGLENDAHLEFYYSKIVRSLCRRAALASMNDKGLTNLNDPRVLDILGKLCNFIVRSLPLSTQGDVCKNVYDLYAADGGFSPVPFSDSPTTEHQRQTMILSTYLLAALPRDITPLPYASPDMAPLLQRIVHLGISEEQSSSTQSSLVRQVGLIVNKFLPKSELSTASDILFSLISGSDKNVQEEQNKIEKLSQEHIRTIFWISKALILRLAPTTTQILTSLLKLLDSPDPTTSYLSARGFSILLAEDDILSTQNGANIRLLSKQRVFTTLIPLISERVRESNSTSTPSNNHVKEAYLTALSGLLSTIPSSLVMTKLPTLLPLLLQSLDLTLTDTESQSIKSASLQTLGVIIRENGVRVINEIGYVDDLVTRLLRTATLSPQPQPHDQNNKTSQAIKLGNNSPRVRAQALQCLLILAKHPSGQGDANGVSNAGEATTGVVISPLLKLKASVIRSLRPALDDPKRDIRKAAVDARAAWLRGVEDEPDDNDDE